jgi:hypothetical protein
VSRTRYVYTHGGVPLPEPIEVGEDYEDPSAARCGPVTDLYMDGTRATDGTDIGSRAKRRAYMQANNVTDASDYTQSWAKARAEREALATAKHDTQARREALGRALYEKQRSKR